MALVDELVQKITIKADTKALDVVQKKEQKLIATTNTLADSFKSAFRWLGGGLLLKSVVDANITLDGLNRSFEALAGSAELGASEIRFLREEALRLGQSFPSIAEAYKGLFATGIGANMDKGVVRGVFSSILEASTVLGASEQETQSAIIALQQMISKGKVMTQELRLQLGNALPGAFQIAAKAMGVSTAELEKMVAKGLDAKDFVQKFGDELHRQFGGNRLTGSTKSLRAEFARLRNALFDLRTGILSGDTGEAFGDVIRAISETLTSEGFRSGLKFIAETLKVILKNARLLIDYFVLYKGVKMLKQIELLSVFMKAFNNELAISNSLSLAMGAGFKTAIKSFLVLTKSSLLFAKNIAIALSILLGVEDLIASLFPGTRTATKRAGASLGSSLSETPDESWMKKLGRNLTMFAGGAIGALFAPDHGASLYGDTEITIPQQIPNVTINQYNATNSNPDEIAEKTKQALTGVFRQYSMEAE